MLCLVDNWFCETFTIFPSAIWMIKNLLRMFENKQENIAAECSNERWALSVVVAHKYHTSYNVSMGVTCAVIYDIGTERSTLYLCIRKENHLLIIQMSSDTKFDYHSMWVNVELHRFRWKKKQQLMKHTSTRTHTKEKKETIKHSEPTGLALTLRHINGRKTERKDKRERTIRTKSNNQKPHKNKIYKQQIQLRKWTSARRQ